MRRGRYVSGAVFLVLALNQARAADPILAPSGSLMPRTVMSPHGMVLIQAPGQPGTPQMPSTPQVPGAPRPGDPTQAAQPPAVPDAFAQAPAGGTVAPGGLTGQMIGDFLGYYATVRAFAVRSSLSDSSVSDYGRVNERTNVAIPILSLGAFKIAENESPRPCDRVFATYNFFNHVPLPFQGGDSFLRLRPNASNFPIFGPGPFPLRRTLGATLDGDAGVSRTNLNTVSISSADVHRMVFGFEKTFLEGSASIGVRLPVFWINQNFAAGINEERTAAFQAPGANNTGTVLGSITNFDESDFGDVSVVLKYALINDRECGNVVSVGAVVTAPTGSSLLLANGEKFRSTLVQPYAGFIYNLEQAYAHGFSSVVVPTVGATDATVLFNDVGVGYRLYSCPDGMITALIPTAEVHVTTPLNNRGLLNEPIGVPNIVALTGGVHVGLGGRSLLTTAVAFPVTGPKVYDIEAIAQLNFKF